MSSERASAVRALMKVRWFGIAFALYQVATFSGTFPEGFRRIGIIGTLIYGALNAIVWWGSRRTLDRRGTDLLAIASLALDFIAICGFVALFTFDDANPIWALLFILPLEGALLFQRRGALGIMALAGVFYIIRDLVEEEVYGDPVVIDGITFRLGVGFIIAMVAGFMHSNFMKERERAAQGERRLEGLLRNSQTITAVIDENGVIGYVSPGVMDVLGYDAKDLVGKVGFDFVVEEDVPIAQESLQRAMSTPGGIAESTFRVYRADGEQRWLQLRARNALDDDAIRGIVANVHDVTDIKEGEHALARLNRSYANLLANLPGMAYRCRNDKDWTLEFISDGALMVTGYTAQELLEARGFDALIHPDDSQRVWDEVQAGIEAEGSFEMEYRIITRDGTEKWLWEQGRTVPGEGGDLFLEGLTIDITERKKLEVELNQAQRMEAVGRLAGGIAHDFNNLMAVVMNYADFIASDLPQDSQMREDVEEIQRAGERGADLVRQLLAFSRRAQVAPEVLAVDTVITNVMNLLRRSVGEDIQILTTLEGEDTVLIDRGQLEQVLMNLVVNARDAMPRGGTLTISTRSARRVRPDTDIQEWVVLSVADDGEGMSPDIVEHIFEPFFTTKEPGKGTGLGLATVYGIVQKAGGWVDVSSRPGEGTTFDIYLPATDAPVDAVEAATLVRAENVESKKVLVVEDEDPVKAVVHRILTEQGHEVVSVSSPEEALREIERCSFDLVISDVVMPGMSGLALSEELERRGCPAPVIFMSGYNEEIVAGQGVEDRFLLQKPFTADELLHAVAERLAPNGGA